MKVDVLALGMLTAMQRSFDLAVKTDGWPASMDQVPDDDTQTYDMICAADTVGVFQIESRAQMSMLPRLRPRKYYDLVVEVAIVRPGPIKGGMVHPYLKARECTGEDRVSQRSTPAGAGEDLRRAYLSGAGDADRHPRRSLHAGRSG